MPSVLFFLTSLAFFYKPLRQVGAAVVQGHISSILIPWALPFFSFLSFFFFSSLFFFNCFSFSYADILDGFAIRDDTFLHRQTSVDLTSVDFDCDPLAHHFICFAFVRFLWHL